MDCRVNRHGHDYSPQPVAEAWYIVRQLDGSCGITDDRDHSPSEVRETKGVWGSFAHRADAIARRVGFISDWLPPSPTQRPHLTHFQFPPALQ